MHIKSGAEVKQTPIYSTSDGKFMMGAQSHDSIPHCIDTKSRVFGGTLRPVTRKNERSTVYGPGTFIRDDKISAKWRPSTSKEAKPIKIYFDGEDALISSDKKGDKGEKMISLKDCKVYEVDRSLSKVPHCLQVVVGGLNKEIQKYYIEVDSADKYNELLSKLQNSTPMDEGPTPPGKRTKSLRIKVCSLDGNLTLPTPVHCQLGFDNSTVQRTPDVNNSKRLCWNSVLYCKHNNVEKSEELKITLCYYKNKKLCELSAGTFNLKSLTNMTFQTYYSPYLSIKNQNGQGRLKLEFYYRDHVVLQPECYQELIRELKRNNFRTLKVLRSSRWCWNHETREAFACVLLTVFSNSKISLIMELTKDEIERHPQNDKGYLFRDNTITTALIVALFQSPPTNIYLDNVFNKITCEINTRVKPRTDPPTEEEKEEDKNAVLDILIESVSEIPQTVLDVIRHILREVATKWPSDPNIQTAILLGVMFVRFYKIRLTNPTDTDISHFHPETQQALLSVAKSIKRKDMDGFLNAILANPSHDSAIYEAPQDNTIDSVEAGDGAHLYHLIQHTIHTTSSNTNSIQHEADKPHLQALLVALDKINRAEKECN